MKAAKPVRSTGIALPGSHLCQWLLIEVSEDAQKLYSTQQPNKLDVKNTLVFGFLLGEHSFIICYIFKLTQGDNR